MLFIHSSTQNDGSMKAGGDDVEQVRKNRKTFLTAHDIRPDNTTLLRLEYGGDNYCRYVSLNESYKGDGITRNSTLDADALVVTEPSHAILLPLADCIGAVLYDETKKVLMVSHLGRHNIEQFGGRESVVYLVNNHGVDPTHLKVWLSPAAGAKNYPLFAFNNRSLHDVAVEQLKAAGVMRENIDISPIDTTTSPDYFSHSEFLKGLRETDGRFAIVAVMRSE